LTTIRLHVCGSWNITKEKNWKIMQCPPIKSSPLSYGCNHYGLMLFFIIVVLCYGAFLIVFLFTLLKVLLFCLFFMHLVLEGNNLAPWFFHACCLASCCNDVVHMKSMPTSFTIGVWVATNHVLTWFLIVLWGGAKAN